jgi:peptide/nickel transport system substrate-binding protein
MRVRTIFGLLVTLGLSTLAGAAPLSFALAGEPVNLDPATTGDANSAYVEAQIYNSLVDFRPGSMTVVPDLAQRWTVSADGLTWTFQLRRNVKFSDGTPFNAEAVRFNVLRWWDPEAPYGAKATGKSFLNWQNNLGGFKNETGSVLKDVRVTDPYTVQLVLNKPFPSLTAVLAGGGSFGIASPTAIKKNAQQYGTPAVGAVGTGPYVFRSWTSGDSVVLSKNPNFYKPGLPKSETITFRFIKDAGARLNELKAGTIDMATDLLPDQLGAVKADARLRPSLNVGYLALNTTYQPLANPQVRLALASAINRRAIVDGFWNGLGVSNAHITPPVLGSGYSKNVTDYAYDPAGARKLLAAAGYPDGFTLDLWYMPVARPYFPTPKPIAEAMAADLTAVGVKVTLRTEDWGKYLEDRQVGKFQAFMLGQVSTSDPIASYSSIMGPASSGDIGWHSAAFDKALDAALRQPTDAARLPYFQAIDELLFHEAVRIPIVHAKLLAVSSVDIKGWVPSPNGNEPLSNVTK